MKNYFNIIKNLSTFTLAVEYGFEKGVLVIQGESGSGKSTILNCLSGLMTPDRGKIVLSGRTVFDSDENIDFATKDRNLGYVFQNYALFPHMTVEKNIIYGIKNKPGYKDKTKKKELLDYMDYIIDTFGISHLREQYPRNISGGEKQRVAFSRAMVTQPELLLLDEPFSALDSQTKKILYKEFESFKQKFEIPTILITHDKKESDMFADQRIELESGHIIET